MSCPNHPHPTFRYWEDLSLLGRVVAQALCCYGLWHLCLACSGSPMPC